MEQENRELRDLKARVQVLAAGWFAQIGSFAVGLQVDEMVVKEVERRCELEMGRRRAKVRVRVGGQWVSGVWHGDTVRRLEVMRPEERKVEARREKVVETPVFLPLPYPMPMTALKIVAGDRLASVKNLPPLKLVKKQVHPDNNHL